MSSPALVSCLCVTEDRHPFLPWLLWNVTKQIHKNIELIIVTPPGDVLGNLAVDLVRDLPKPPFPIRVVPCEPDTSLGERRNVALRHATGAFVAWFDDDDFSTPDRIDELVRILEHTGGAFAGCRELWFWDLWADRADHLPASDITTAVAMNTALVRTELALRVPFRPIECGEDVRWMADLCFAAGNEGYFTPNPHGFCLAHSSNTSNHRDRRRWTIATSEVRKAFGRVALRGLDPELEGLRAQLRAAGRGPTIE